MRFPDIELALMEWLRATFDYLADPPGRSWWHVGGQSPGAAEAGGLSDRLPFVTVERIGGGDNFFTDFPMVEIVSLGRTRQEAYAIADDIRTELHRPLLKLGGIVIDTVNTNTAPRRYPVEADRTFASAATYELSARRAPRRSSP